MVVFVVKSFFLLHTKKLPVHLVQWSLLRLWVPQPTLYCLSLYFSCEQKTWKYRLFT